jgi:hypothetical protein
MMKREVTTTDELLGNAICALGLMVTITIATGLVITDRQLGWVQGPLRHCGRRLSAIAFCLASLTTFITTMMVQYQTMPSVGRSRPSWKVMASPLAPSCSTSELSMSNEEKPGVTPVLPSARTRWRRSPRIRRGVPRIWLVAGGRLPERARNALAL